MRPVERGKPPRKYKNYEDAKPDLIDRLGPYCSYCERSKDPQDLHVEHIYPKAKTAHPKRERSWRNFLLACSSCNTYKAKHLGDYRQSRLLRRFLWPHVDNTFSAFEYDNKGQVSPSSSVKGKPHKLAKATINMIGALRSPAVAKKYRELGISYDGASRREEAWGTATVALATYQANPAPDVLTVIVKLCVLQGHFSIWMEVFNAHPAVRRAFCDACKIADACFNTQGQPQRRGRC